MIQDSLHQLARAIMQRQERKFKNAGFTLVELLVVISIISLLSSVVFASVNSARSKARDARRKSDLHAIQLALEFYFDKYGTYQVSGTGSGGCSCGWAGYEDSGAYAKAVTRGLQQESFLNAPLVDDPVSKPGYMLYLCAPGSYALSARWKIPARQTSRTSKPLVTARVGMGPIRYTEKTMQSGINCVME